MLMASARVEAFSVREAYAQLVRASSLAGRPGIVILDEDLSALAPPDGSKSGSHSLLAAVEREGYLRRVRRGTYVLLDSAGGVRTGLLDLIAALTPKPYLVSAGRALQFHELSDQHFRRVHVLVGTQLRSWSWRGDEVRYSRTDRSLRGASTRTRKTRAKIATPERAIADSLAHPQWGVTLTQAVEALDTLLSRDPASADRLAGEIAAHDSHALARRLGFLVAHLAGKNAARSFLALRGQSKAATPLRTGAPATGPIDSTWHVQENVDLEQLIRPRQSRR
jgi:predicted transcriptional regulator of viral defense system